MKDTSINTLFGEPSCGEAGSEYKRSRTMANEELETVQKEM